MILVLVFIGSILTAAGGLYFIDIKFCKDWFQAMVMLVGGLLMVAGGEIAVTGSSTSYFKAQQVRTSLCELEGEGAHPNERRDDSEGVIFKHIVGCMKSAGYMWTTSHNPLPRGSRREQSALLSSERRFRANGRLPVKRRSSDEASCIVEIWVKNGLGSIRGSLSPIGFARYSGPWKAKRRARDQKVAIAGHRGGARLQGRGAHPHLFAVFQWISGASRDAVGDGRLPYG